jgi:hypothetical protein
MNSPPPQTNNQFLDERRLIMKKVFMIVLMCMLTGGFLAVSAEKGFSATKYSVFCANGKVEVDSRTLTQMKSARGSGTCIIKSFDNKMDADKSAKSVGGVGASCKCK